jgi:hypothetical protein
MRQRDKRCMERINVPVHAGSDLWRAASRLWCSCSLRDVASKVIS